MTLAEDVQQKLASELEADHVQCVDVSDGGCSGAKLELVVVSKQFEGMPLLQRHRRVHDAVDEYKPQIHAMTIKAWTPSQYNEQLNK